MFSIDGAQFYTKREGLLRLEDYNVNGYTRGDVDATGLPVAVLQALQGELPALSHFLKWNAASRVTSGNCYPEATDLF